MSVIVCVIFKFYSLYFSFQKCVTALEKTWHTEHFFCAQCGKQFGEEGFHERDGKPYCRDDYFDMFAPKCGGCNRPIMENYISALNSQWHADCFVCRVSLEHWYVAGTMLWMYATCSVGISHLGTSIYVEGTVSIAFLVAFFPGLGMKLHQLSWLSPAPGITSCQEDIFFVTVEK